MDTKVKYLYFFSKKYEKRFSIVVLNEFHLEQFRDDMFCPCCKEAKLFFKKNAKTPHLAKLPSSNHHENCYQKIKFYNEEDLVQLEEKEIKNKLLDNFKKFNLTSDNNINEFAINFNKTDEKLEALTVLDDNFSKNIEYEIPGFVVGKNIKIRKYLKDKNNEKESYEENEYKNFITLFFNNHYLLGIGFTDRIKEKIFKVIGLYIEDKKTYNISFFSKITKESNFRKSSIRNSNFIEIWE